MTALTPLQIRAATLDDATALAALSAQLGYATTPEQLRQRLAWLQQHGEPVWLACVDGAIAGYLACQRYVTLYLAPRPEHHGTGGGQHAPAAGHRPPPA